MDTGSHRLLSPADHPSLLNTDDSRLALQALGASAPVAAWMTGKELHGEWL